MSSETKSRAGAESLAKAFHEAYVSARPKSPDVGDVHEGATGKDTGRKGKPRFRIGQVVMCDLPEKALKIHSRWYDKGTWWYAFLYHYPEKEMNLRRLTKMERGA